MPRKRTLSESTMNNGDPLVVKKAREAAEPANQVLLKDFYIKKNSRCIMYLENKRC